MNKIVISSKDYKGPTVILRDIPVSDVLKMIANYLEQLKDK